MKIIHNNKFRTVGDKSTFVIGDDDLTERLAQAIKELMTGMSGILSISVGITRCHPKDQYVKAKGVEMAKNNIYTRHFSIDTIINSEDHLHVGLTARLDKLHMNVKIYKDSGVVRITSLDFTSVEKYLRCQ